MIKAFKELFDADKGSEVFHWAENVLKFLVLGDGLDFESFLHV